MRDPEGQLQRTKRILELSHEMTSTVSLESLLAQIVEAAVELTGSASAGILMLDEQAHNLRFTTVSDSAGQITGIPVPIEHSVAGHVFSIGQPIIVPDVRADPRYYDGVEKQIGVTVRSLMAAPLQLKDRRIGVLEVENKCCDHEFNQDDLEILEALAVQATVALENAQLYRQIERHRDHLQELVDERTSELKKAVADAHLLNRQLAEEIEERESLIADLEAFTHTVAHDLKNPVGLIIGYGQLLLQKLVERGDVELIRLVEPIRATADRINRIIDELLTLANVRQRDIIPYPLDMNAILTEVEARLAPMITEAQAEIIKPAEWPPALGYAPWIEEVWANYISNGIKYGGHPPRLELGADAGPSIRFWIRDNGAGIAPKIQAKLFTKFARLDQMHTQGYGLGLSIVKRIVEKLGGQVGVESAAGQGSLFFFTLPAMTVDHQSEEVIASPETQYPLLIAALARFERHIIDELHTSVAEGDVIRTQSVIAKIAAQDRSLGEVLDMLAHNFDYNTILTLISRAEERGSAPHASSAS